VPEANDDLEMKWNDAWLQSGLRGALTGQALGLCVIQAQAWLTNHQKGVYLMVKARSSADLL
jgi:hypothetical protein